MHSFVIRSGSISLQRVVEWLWNPHLPDCLSLNSTISAVTVMWGIEKRITYTVDQSCRLVRKSYRATLEGLTD